MKNITNNIEVIRSVNGGATLYGLFWRNFVKK